MGICILYAGFSNTVKGSEPKLQVYLINFITLSLQILQILGFIDGVKQT